MKVVLQIAIVVLLTRFFAVIITVLSLHIHEQPVWVDIVGAAFCLLTILLVIKAAKKYRSLRK
jgi:hypothetical protein